MTDSSFIPELDSPEYSEGREEFLASPPTVRTCPACQYPHTSPACDNPGCSANPAISPAVQAKWALDQVTRDTSGQERAARLRLWGSSFAR